MNTLQSLLTVTVVAALPIPVQANGGGYHQGVKSSGTFKPKNVEKVKMETEKLEIDLFAGRATVKVDYTLRNPGAAVTVEAGFPVAFAADYYGDEEAKEALRKNPPKLEKFKVLANGKEIKAKFESGEIELEDGFGEGGGSIITGWMSFKLPFKNGEVLALHAEYESPYYFTDEGISDDTYRSPDKFSYLFSSAALWDGPIKKGSVSIHAHDVDPAMVKLNQSKRFKKQGDSWVWNFEDLEPTLADDLVIATTEGIFTTVRMEPDQERCLSKYVQYGSSGRSEEGLKGGRWELQSTDFSAKVSSALKSDGEELSYDEKSMLDFSPGTAWAEGVEGDGVGESITLKFAKPTKVGTIGIVNGYGKSAELHQANNRVAEFSVAIDGGKPFDVALPDEGPAKRFELQIPKSNETVSEIKLTIKKVYKGTKFRDTCVSDIFVVKPLKKAPEIQPAR